MEEESPRERISSGARNAFLRFGYDGASMRTIAQYTGFSQAGISHHFATKAELLGAVADESFSCVERCLHAGADRHGKDLVKSIWLSLTRQRSHVAMRTVILSEASILDHPALEASLASTATVTQIMADRFPEVSDPEVFARMLEGLLKMWLYDARIDGPAVLESGYVALSEQAPSTPRMTSGSLSSWRAQLREATSHLPEPEPEEQLGDQRRRSILDAATRLFGEQGYVGASLRDIAGALGVTHPAVLRYYNSKERLFQAILDRYDGGLVDVEAMNSPLEIVRQLLDFAGALEQQPGLIPLHTSTDARSHQRGTVFHDFFANRRRNLQALHRIVFEGLAQTGELRADLQPEAQSLAFLALWSGAQIYWTLDKEPSTQIVITNYVKQTLSPGVELS